MNHMKPHGPVLSFTLEKINDSPHDRLSPAEERLLDGVFAEFGGMSQWDIPDYSHTLPEWRDPNGSSLPIAWRDILLAEGLSEGDVRDVEEDLQAEELADDLLS